MVETSIRLSFGCINLHTKSLFQLLNEFCIFQAEMPQIVYSLTHKIDKT